MASFLGFRRPDKQGYRAGIRLISENSLNRWRRSAVPSDAGRCINTQAIGHDIRARSSVG